MRKWAEYTEGEVVVVLGSRERLHIGITRLLGPVWCRLNFFNMSHDYKPNAHNRALGALPQLIFALAE